MVLHASSQFSSSSDFPEISPYIPPFFWRLWLSDADPFKHSLDHYRVHIYDVFQNLLSETRRAPECTRTVFAAFDTGTLDDGCKAALKTAEEAFYRLENAAERIIEDIVAGVRSSRARAPPAAGPPPVPCGASALHSNGTGANGTGANATVGPSGVVGEPPVMVNWRTELPLHRRERDVLVRYLVFLRYRNGEQFADTIRGLSIKVLTDTGTVVSAKVVWHRVRRRALLSMYHAFLCVEYISGPGPTAGGDGVGQHKHNRVLEHSDRFDCWRFTRAEVCVGVAGQEQQYLLPDTCFGILSEDFSTDPDNGDFFFPITPTICVYLIASSDDEPMLSYTATLSPSNPMAMDIDEPFSFPSTTNPHANATPGPGLNTLWIECGTDSASDVHLRNAATLQSHPHHLYFSSLASIVRAISAYDEVRAARSAAHVDYSRLRQRCRQKATVEGVTKTLVVKGSVLLVDLTEEVVRVGNMPLASGAFSDVWKGVWRDGREGRERAVAIKYLRQFMVDGGVKEKLLKRLKSEVAAWHRLQHPNIAQLFGVIQSMSTIAMVSPWCNNGTIMHYLEKVDPSADRVDLLVQIASGISYLHNYKPVVIHGDLKGNNVLIDDHGRPLVTDFGLSSVLEDFNETLPARVGTSCFAGSTRWMYVPPPHIMAPELLQALVEEDWHTPPRITPSSDVYAYASLALEVATGQVPYPHRRTDHAIIVDVVMRGVRPARPAPGAAAECFLRLPGDGAAFWDVVERCWGDAEVRPGMGEVCETLRRIAGA
ncbi:kinase-like protein [Coniophora puteana RWD-64-598 SS2]|uniref:Kinase-like protein n=1 Tax=Coniophora puteana (strain RWD-64-598) TaxID=741705 RepID=A0A5M3MFH3_CONPW|nr:kinase-like protein [Coniophora puteana RWD-64-598 SS2]EIW77962.1 kinase-like protein [Coniophora puteana RWD-64-598 SS2]